MLKILLIVLAIGITSFGKGQQRWITGKILSETNEPVIGANISVGHSMESTISDSLGNFHLQAIDKDLTLYISHIGFESQSFNVVRSQNTFEIYLRKDETLLKDVVVSTGYQNVSKDRSTGSYTLVNNNLFNRSTSTDVLSRLENVTSGLLFDRRSNGEPILTIRGRSTILSNAAPLIVVDNFPYEGNINNLNPNDIEKVTILKDAASASIWGARAGNGVIVITTKKGSPNQPLKIIFNSNFSIGNKPDLYANRDFLNSRDFIEVEQKLFSQDYYKWQEREKGQTLSPVVQLLIAERDGKISSDEAKNRIDELKGIDVRKDILKYYYQKSLNRQYSLSLSGGQEQFRYYFSGSLDQNRDNLVRNSLNRFTINSSTTYLPVKSLEISTGIAYVNSIQKQNNTGPSQINSGGGKQLYPYATFADSQRNPLSIERNYNSYYIGQAIESGFLNWYYKPLEDLHNTNNTLNTENIRIKASAKYHVFDWINIESIYQYERQSLITKNLQNEKLYYVRNLINQYAYEEGDDIKFIVPRGSIFDQSTSSLVSKAGRAQMNVNKNWYLKHEVSALAGVEVREVNTTGFSSRLYGYNNDLATFTPVDLKNRYPVNPYGYSDKIPSFASVMELTDRNVSYYANAAYTYKQRYIISGSARKDASNLFGVKANQKWVPLWSAGIAWIASSEKNYPFALWLPYLKFRATTGYNGNINKSLTAYTTASYSTNFNTGLTQLQILTPPNPQLRWEKINILNFGIDFQTKNDLLSGSIEYYRKNGDDLIGNSPLDPTAGYNVAGRTNFTGNNANIKGYGIDLQLTFRKKINKIEWTSNLLFSYTTEKVTHFEYEGILSSYLSNFPSPVVGKPRFGIYSFKSATLNPGSGAPQIYLAGKVTQDYATVIYTATLDDLVYNGPALPTTFGSWRNNFSFSGFSIGMNISYKFGYYFRRSSINYFGLFDKWAGNIDFENRWKKPGDESITSIPSMPSIPNSSREFVYSSSSSLVERGDHIRFQDVNLSYKFEKSKNKWLPFSAVSVYGYLNNLGILWSANNYDIDPDFVFQPYPPSKTYSLGISVQF